MASAAFVALLFIVPLTVALPHEHRPSDVWRFPYSSNKYVVGHGMHDQLPDFAFADENGTFTPETIACPAALQQKSCTGKHTGDDHGCCENKSQHWAAGGIWCESLIHDIQRKANQTVPNFIGKGLARPAISRTRENILQRAIGWLAVHTPYLSCGTPKTRFTAIETCAQGDPEECPQYTHTASCEGFIHMAWGMPGAPHDNPPGFKNLTAYIEYTSLKPGDAVSIHSSKGDEPHVIMFREWIDTKQVGGAFRLYQMGGEHGAANMAVKTNPKWCPFHPGGCGKKCKSCLEPHKYNKVIE